MLFRVPPLLPTETQQFFPSQRKSLVIDMLVGWLGLLIDSDLCDVADRIVRTNCFVKMRGNFPGAGKCRNLWHDDECIGFKSGHEEVFFCRFFWESAGLDIFG